MSLIATALVFLVASLFIRASGNPVPPVAFTPKPNDLKDESKQESTRFKRMDPLLEKYLNGPTKRPGWWHYENCMGQPCSLKRI
ncbi:hypothetical protein V3C99_015616 [Haemonchus contortus]|uniref:Secreted protein n=1 Tax=Haemonchus contortus TaxID=6289 RepID=A0A7I5EEU4_HAECO